MLSTKLIFVTNALFDTVVQVGSSGAGLLCRRGMSCNVGENDWQLRQWAVLTGYSSH